MLVPVGSGVLAVPVFVVLDEEDDDPEPLCEGEVEVEVEFEFVGELEEVDEVGAAEEVVVVVVLVVTPTDGVVVVEGAHCSFWETITPCTGSPMAEIGVPGATLTWNTYVWPPTTVIVTVHSSAEALGSAAIAMATKSAPARASTANSLRRPIMAAPLRPSLWWPLQWNNGENLR
ncbi:MAG: hypothetical protein ACXVR1_00315 [Solirubrobacteraceae bacterium]